MRFVSALPFFAASCGVVQRVLEVLLRDVVQVALDLVGGVLNLVLRLVDVALAAGGDGRAEPRRQEDARIGADGSIGPDYPRGTLVGRMPSDPLASFNPRVRDWFTRSFERPTEAQAKAWPAIAAGENVLVSAPTGSGKTLAAFLWALDRLVSRPAPEGERRTRLVYVSPLKALSYDVEKNLRAPLKGIGGDVVGRDPHRRHAPARAPGDAAHAAGRADHDAGVALPDAHLAGARVPGGRRGRDRRRDPRRGPHQARRAPRAHARAARGAGRAAAPADRAVGHAAAARGGGPLPRRHRPRLHSHRRRHAQAARPEDPRAGREHARAGRPRRDRPRRGRHGHGGGRRRPGRARAWARHPRPPRRARSGRRSTPSCSG